MFEYKQREQLRKYIQANFMKITVNSGVCRFNYKCLYNAVHDAIVDNENELAMCVYLDGSYPILHFINISDGIYTDNTLGQWSSQYDYYLIRLISKEEFFNIENIFTTYREELSRKSKWHLRIFSRYIP